MLKKNKTMKTLRTLLFLLMLPLISIAQEPLQLVEQNVNQVIDILNALHEIEPEDADAIEAQRLRAREVLVNTFDFNVLSRRSLGRNYKAFSSEQYKTFVDLFTELLFNNYYNRIKDYTVSKVDYVKEVRLSKSKAEVQTIVYSNGQKYPIEYRLYVKDGTWRVYDVIIEGISMINNYRSQFNSLLDDHKAEELLEKLRHKTD